MLFVSCEIYKISEKSKHDELNYQWGTSKHKNMNENEYEIATLKWLQAEYEKNIYIY